jgi:hypothetical protein
MTKFNSTHKFTVAAAFGASAILSMLSFGSNAEAARNPLSCHGSTAKEVMECCAEITNDHRPSWMIKTGGNCHTSFVATCRKAHTAAAANLGCYLKPRTAVFLILDESGGPGSSVGTGTTRGTLGTPN